MGRKLLTSVKDLRTLIYVLCVADRGCPAAVLRLWTDLTQSPIELCGEKLSTDKWQYISTSNAVRFR